MTTYDLPFDKMAKNHICCICLDEYKTGNSTYPIIKHPKAYCCDSCNTYYVVPQRELQLIMEEHKSNYKRSLGN